MLEILLSYKDQLNININEQVGDKKLTALHHVAMKQNAEGYALLICNGAIDTLQDSEGKTAQDIMSHCHTTKKP